MFKILIWFRFLDFLIFFYGQGSTQEEDRIIAWSPQHAHLRATDTDTHTCKHSPPTRSVLTLHKLLGANRFAMLPFTDPITESPLAINFQLKITIMPITCILNHIISVLCHYTIIVITPMFLDCHARGTSVHSSSDFD